MKKCWLVGCNGKESTFLCTRCDRKIGINHLLGIKGEIEEWICHRCAHCAREMWFTTRWLHKKCHAALKSMKHREAGLRRARIV